MGVAASRQVHKGLLQLHGDEISVPHDSAYLVVGRAKAEGLESGASVTAAGAGVWVQVGKNHDGYFTGPDFHKQLKHLAVPTFEAEFPDAIACFVFDNASSHVAFEEGALKAMSMNVNDGGRQPFLRDTWFWPLGISESARTPENRIAQAMRYKEGDKVVQKGVCHGPRFSSFI